MMDQQRETPVTPLPGSGIEVIKKIELSRVIKITRFSHYLSRVLSFTATEIYSLYKPSRVRLRLGWN